MQYIATAAVYDHGFPSDISSCSRGEMGNMIFQMEDKKLLFVVDNLLVDEADKPGGAGCRGR